MSKVQTMTRIGSYKCDKCGAVVRSGEDCGFCIALKAKRILKPMMVHTASTAALPREMKKRGYDYRSKP